MRTYHRSSNGKIVVAMAGLGAIGLLAAGPMARATNISWTGTGTDWNTTGDWNPAQVPGSGDYAYFGVSGTQTVDLNGSQSVQGLNFTNSSGNVTLQGGSGDQTLTFANPLGENLQLTNPSGSTVIIGSNTAGQQVNILLDNNGSFSFVMDAQGPVSILNGIAGGATTGNTATLNFATHGGSTNNVTLGGVVSDGTAGGNLAIDAGFCGILYLTGENTFTGGIAFYGTINVASLSDYGVASAIGARTAAQDSSQNGPGAIRASCETRS